MKIHEYQGRELMAGAGIPVPQGFMVESANEAASRAEEIFGNGATTVVVKAQVHAGGRGKAGFVKLCNSAAEVRSL